MVDETYVGGLRDVLGDFRAQALLILDEAHHAAPVTGSRYAIDSQFTRPRASRPRIDPSAADDDATDHGRSLHARGIRGFDCGDSRDAGQDGHLSRSGRLAHRRAARFLCRAYEEAPESSSHSYAAMCITSVRV
jgi:hypothetical protein